MLALAKHRHAVAYRHNLVEFMGDDDNALAVLAHRTEHLEEFFGLLRSENCGGFVENENIRTAVKHLYDFDSLLFADRHIVNFLL